MLTYLLAGLGAWFIAALGLGIVLGKLINAHERSARLADGVREPSAPRAA